MGELRRTELIRIGIAASEARERLLRGVQRAGAAVVVSAVGLHLVDGQEDAAEWAAQVHCRIGRFRHSVPRLLMMRHVSGIATLRRSQLF